MKDKKIILIEVTVTLKDSQLSKKESGTEYWSIHFDGKLFVNAERVVKFYTPVDIDPSPRINHEEIESFTTKVIYE